MLDDEVRVVTLPGFREDLDAALAAEGIRADIKTGGDGDDGAMRALLPGSHVLVAGTFRAGWLDPRRSSLRLIQVPGAGVDGIELGAVPPGCIVANTFHHEYGIAEYCFMAMALLNREVVALDRGLRAGLWGDGRPQRELRGRRLLLVGLGRIGNEVARWGNFVGMRVSAVTRRPREARRTAAGLERLGALDDLRAWAADADFVVVAVPATPETIGLVGASVLAALPRTAYLLNVGRGPVVDEAALYEALRDRRIAGAAIDTWYRYPAADEEMLPSSLPFHELENVVMTPHVAGLTEGTMRRRWAEIAANIRCVLDGREPANRIWPSPG